MRRILIERISKILKAKIQLLNNESMQVTELKIKQRFDVRANEVQQHNDFLELTSELDDWAQQNPAVQE